LLHSPQALMDDRWGRTIASLKSRRPQSALYPQAAIRDQKN
jgi:hypothetical protein